MSQNIPQFSVTEFSRVLKNTIENAFGYVKISGEISGFKKASSGHLYFNLKEENALLTAVCFRNQAKNINFEIADGLQIMAYGQITTYEGRSNYQIIVDKIEIAGIGAILEMLEKRKQKLTAEGLFDQSYKKPIPFFPKIVGVITSETGAVIEDIKHRISNRSGLHLLLYPSAVQGDKAVIEIIQGIKYFNNLKHNKPEVVIIARGGGSFEDLLPFSDENLVREVFKSDIPIISAIGHETDYSLLDLVADLRAPTPTASAEFVTPVLSDLKNGLKNLWNNINNYTNNYFQNKILIINNLQKNIISPYKFLELGENKFNNAIEKIHYHSFHFIQNKILIIKNLNINLENLQKNIEIKENKLVNFQEKINLFLNNFINNNYLRLKNILLDEKNILSKIDNNTQIIQFNFNNIERIIFNKLNNYLITINAVDQTIKSNNYHQIINRGFAVVRDINSKVITDFNNIKNNQKIKVELANGKFDAITIMHNNAIKNIDSNKTSQSNLFESIENKN